MWSLKMPVFLKLTDSRDVCARWLADSKQRGYKIGSFDEQTRIIGEKLAYLGGSDGGHRNRW